MGKSNYRWQNEIKPIENMSSASKLIGMNTIRQEPRFKNTKNYVSTTFKKDTYLYNVAEIPYTYDKEFTVCFWAKFEKLKNVDEVHPNCIHIIFNDGTSIGTVLPKTIGANNTELVQTDWNWYKIQRDSENTVTIYINNEQIATGTNTAVFDLNDKSYLYLGNDSKTLTGYNVTVDDVLIFGGTNEYLKDIPTDYLDLSKFYKMVYIKSSDNSVWAMRESSVSGGAVINLCTGTGLVNEYKREFYKDMDKHVKLGFDNDDFCIEPNYVYTTGPLEEFSLEILTGSSTIHNTMLRFQDKMSKNVLEIHFVDDDRICITKYYPDSEDSTRTPQETWYWYSPANHYIYAIRKNNKVSIYYNDRTFDYNKARAEKMYEEDMPLTPYQVRFVNANASGQDEPNRQMYLLRISNKADDLYYAT